MGVQNGTDVLFTLSGVKFHHLYSIAEKRASAAGRTTPALAVDFSWLCNKLRRGSLLETRDTIISVLKNLANQNLLLYVVQDPPQRHHSKKATIARRVQLERAKLQAVQQKTRLIQISQILRSIRPCLEKVELQEERKSLESSIKALESKLDSRICQEYQEMLHDAMQSLSDSESRILLRTGAYQADTMIIHLALSGQTDMILGNDGDFSFLCGSKSIQICDFKLVKLHRRKRVSKPDCSSDFSDHMLENIVLRASNELSIKECCQVVGINATSPGTGIKSQGGLYKPARYPLLNGVADIKVRALIATVLGNDTFPVAVKNSTTLSGTTPCALSKLVSNTQPNIRNNYWDLLEAIIVAGDKRNSKKDWLVGIDCDTLNVFVDAMVYEPVSFTNGSFVYIDAAPARISEYLAEFVDEKVPKVGPCILVCPGTGLSAAHPFLAVEPTVSCSMCRKRFCQLCIERSYNKCIDCSKSICIGQESIASLTEQELRSKLGDRMEVPSTATISDLQEWMESYESMDAYFDIGSVKYPTHSPRAVVDGSLDIIVKFDFKDGARFIAAPQLSAARRADIVLLFASLLDFGDSEQFNSSKCKSKFEPILPKCLLDFAEGSRIDGGGRLQERCIRHAMDSKCPPATTATGDIFVLNEEVGLRIDGKVPPSYKEGMYRVTAAFTQSELICSTCDCKAGLNIESTGHSCHRHHICVHCMPLIYLVTLLLLDGLAEHFLVEFASVFSEKDESAMSLDKNKRLFNALSALIATASSRGLSPMGTVVQTEKSCMDLLKPFRVGTQQFKCPKVPAPNPDTLGPIRHHGVRSAHAKALNIINGQAAKQVPATPECYRGPDLSCPMVPDYILMECACQEIASILRGHFDGKQSDKLGLRVLAYRAKKSKTMISEEALGHVSIGVQKAIRQAMLATQERRAKGGSKPSNTPQRLFGATARNLDPQLNVACQTGAGSNPMLCAQIDKSTSLGSKCKTFSQCAHHGCNNLFSKSGSRTRRVPPVPMKPSVGASEIRWKTYQRKLKKRFCFLDRIGMRKSHPDYFSKHLRICQSHPVEPVKKTYHFDSKGKRRTETVIFQLPCANGQSTTKTNSKGTARDRSLFRLLEQVKSNLSENEVCDRLALQQAVEVSDGRTILLRDTNPVVLQAASLDVHVETPKKKRKSEVENKCSDAKAIEPSITIERLTDWEVKRRTGFASLANLLFHAVIVCNGSMELLVETKSTMTWLEEWLLYYQALWRKASSRWIDMGIEFQIDERICRRVFHSKLSIATRAVHAWPRWLRHEEDVAFRKNKWLERYKDQRVQFWDNTNVNFIGKPTNADTQRQTFSAYYGGNVAKGGIGLQLSGWISGWELWEGAVSDTVYFEKSSLLEEQEKFQKWDTSTNRPFTNILDKGYRSILAAWHAGGQLLLQPFFAKSDRKFTSEEVLRSAAIAADRAANERAVKRMKESGMIGSRGIHQRESLEMWADVWLAWGFQCNFMFQPVL